MSSLSELLTKLAARLPELEWKLSAQNPYINSTSLPRGLFSGLELTPSLCIEEIKKEMQLLSQQDNERSVYYLANRITQKINVLVAICQISSRHKKPEEKIHFGVKKLSTRQQWIQTLEDDISLLTAQHEAMEKTLEQMKTSANTAAILSLKGELGEVEKRLTLAKEMLQQAIS